MREPITHSIFTGLHSSNLFKETRISTNKCPPFIPTMDKYGEIYYEKMITNQHDISEVFKQLNFTEGSVSVDPTSGAADPGGTPPAGHGANPASPANIAAVLSASDPATGTPGASSSTGTKQQTYRHTGRGLFGHNKSGGTTKTRKRNKYIKHTQNL